MGWLVHLWKESLKVKGIKILFIKTKTELNLINQLEVEKFLKEKPDYVLLAAAKVGGILQQHI